MIDNLLEKDIKEYKEINEELNKGEEIIKNKIDKNINFDDGCEKYGLLDIAWVKKYKKHIMDFLDGKCKKNEFTYKFGELEPKKEEKKFFLKNDFRTFHFHLNYKLVTKNFISLISKYFSHHDQKQLNNRLYSIFIGGQCIIRKSHNNDLIYYITLLYDDNDDNKVDYILLFEDKNKIRENLNIILKKNFWSYFKLINFSFDLESTDILDYNMYKVIGHIFCNCKKERRQFLEDMMNKMNNNNYLNNNLNNKNIVHKNNNNTSNLYKKLLFIF